MCYHVFVEGTATLSSPACVDNQNLVKRIFKNIFYVEKTAARGSFAGYVTRVGDMKLSKINLNVSFVYIVWSAT